MERSDHHTSVVALVGEHSPRIALNAMPFVPAPNIIMVEFRYLYFSQQCENRIMIDNLAAPDATALEDTAILCWNWWETEFAPLTSAAVLLTAVVTTDMSDVNGAQFTYAPDSTTTGEDGGSVLPNEVSFCISLRSGQRGRSARGRWFVAGLPQSAMSGANNISSTAAGNFVSAMNALIAAISAAGQLFVIVSYRADNAPRPGGPVYFPVSTAVAVDTIVDSQRRRRPGVGS